MVALVLNFPPGHSFVPMSPFMSNAALNGEETQKFGRAEFEEIQRMAMKGAPASQVSCYQCLL